ncbi:hypothetical protein OIO07_20715 [Bacillus paralicheniformis]|uniref:hypothetical protein n=3 Tax=Bacillus paralicheniformis TaxID=1648923 RepID=UPI00034243D6|nr:hypothetical protein [Bacillus paralicheniformis]KUL10046.1 hypothetical protein LI7559_10610 [Bacillus licheniformis LMG 7559]AGN37667.1 hypothetical protein BaLi_c33490 [Bacillus paralicheniformis ATCC 9945a]AYQ17740.1 hypothetical protein D5285_17595 [Bacillus paralicheniformis]KFM83655.1 hypothetical protein DJ88_4371 [Bacillus paralicheniformis]KND05324.1 hypothetical protein ACJ43_22055 [Bacillus paralicheniformis]
MHNLLKENLGEDYAVISHAEENKIGVYQKFNNCIYQETFVELQENTENNMYYLILNQRGNEFIKEEFDNKEEGICALGIYAVSILGDRIRDIETQDKILELEDNEIKSLNKLLDLKIGENYFSIFKEKKIAVNLEQTKNGLYNIFYMTPDFKKVYLIKDREAPSAFLVLYNFSLKLKEVISLLNLWKNDFNINMQFEEKIRRLILGK